jgi:hypothetical protein
VAVAATAEEESGGFDLVNDEQSGGEVVFDSGSGDDGSIEELEADIMEGVDDGVVNDAQPFNSITATIQQTSTPIRASLPPPSSPKRDVTLQSVAVLHSSESGGGADYEFIASGGHDGDDGSIDELEAEIAAALDD